MEIYEPNFVLILLGRTEFFCLILVVYYASNATSPVNRFQSTKYFGNGVAKGVYIKLCSIIQKIAKI